MFDINKFYKQAENGEKIDEAELFAYLKSFKNLVIWGAGNLGTALGKYLLDRDVKISAYWDARYNELLTCNGIAVMELFTGAFIPEETLVIIGIVNGTLSHKWQSEELINHKFAHYIFGMQMYEGVVCDMCIGQKYTVQNCTGTSICNFNTCKKYMSILKNECDKKDIISIQVLEFIISRRCTLHCIHCGQQETLIRTKFPQKYKDYELERIKRDIDICMNNIDVVGTFSIIGGEPFIHPHIAEIIEHCLSKKNVAIISVTTNGICNMPKETLKRIKNDRVKINFSNYTNSLGVKEKEIFNGNLKKVKEMGLNCNNATPVWSSVSDELRENPDCSPAYLTEVKKNCVMGPSISDGKLYICPMTELYSKTERADVENNYIDLDTDSNVRESIKLLLNRPYYNTCGYRCGNSTQTQEVEPGEQMKRVGKING